MTRNEAAQAFLRSIFDPLPHGTCIEVRWIGPGGTRQEFFPSVESILVDRYDETMRVWFGAALRKAGASRGRKEDVAAVTCLWADVDDYGAGRDALISRLRHIHVPPTVVVWSGGGAHVYWRLKEPLWVADDDQRIAWVERTLRGLTSVVRGDPAACDIARVMGLVGTWNSGDGKKKVYDPPVLREVVHYDPDAVYTIEDLNRLSVLASDEELDALPVSAKIRRLITEGWWDGCGYASRSEADLAVMMALVGAGLDDSKILEIFERYPIGQKGKEDGERYLKRTLQRAKAYIAEVPDPIPVGTIVERNGVLMVRRSGNVQWAVVYTSPMRAVYRVTGAETGWIVEVRGADGPAQVLLRAKDFSSARDLKKALRAHGAWVGSDADAQRLIPFLEAQDAPKRRAASIVGWDEDGAVLFPNAQLTPSGDYVDSPDYLYIGRHPELRLHPPVDDYERRLRGVVDLLCRAQSKPRVLVVVGWFLATLAAPFIRRMSTVQQYPLLLVYGEREAGKTSLCDVLSRMVGAVVPETANITPWALIQTIGSANAVPVWLDEFRADIARNRPTIAAILRSAYNAKYESRGRPNLELERVQLLAPVVVSGEAPWSDQALLDRTLAVRLFRSDLRLEDLHEATELATGLNGSLFRHVIRNKDRLEMLWAQAKRDADALDKKISHRVRHAHAVAAFGLRLFGYEPGRALVVVSEDDRPEADMGEQPIIGETLRAVIELIRGGKLREGVDYVVADGKLILTHSTVLPAVEEYFARFPSELPITRHVIRQQLGSAARSGWLGVKSGKLGPRHAWAHELDLAQIEEELGIPRDAFTKP